MTTAFQTLPGERVGNLSWLADSRVAFAWDKSVYPKSAPFHASEAFPEWAGQTVGSEDNPAYRAVRQCLLELELDAGHVGTADWNPLGDLISPGAVVVLKPNWVSHRNLGEEAYGLTDTDCLITHGSVIRAVLDYTCKALRGNGRVVIGDSPIQGTDWSELMRLSGVESVVAHAAKGFPGVRISVEDFRVGKAVVLSQKVVRRSVDGERLSECLEVDIGADSFLTPLMRGLFAFGVADYPSHRMRRAHTTSSNLYLVPKSVLEADVFINLPKMKSHMKAGITCALKNLVGIVGLKDYLPHFRFGSPQYGGDEYPDGSWLWQVHWNLVHQDWERDGGAMKAFFIAAAKACRLLLRTTEGLAKTAFTVGGGGWHGNDTLWRTILDLNRSLLYFDRQCSRVMDHPQKPIRYLAILDGLVGGDKESPLCPSPIPAGSILAAFNPLALDCAAAALMGFDLAKIKQLSQAFGSFRYPLARFSIREVTLKGAGTVGTLEEVVAQANISPFNPSLGWKGKLERANSPR